MKYRKIVAQVLKIPEYTKVIQVNVPVRFYWDGKGFDSIEFGPLPKTTRYQLKLLDDILDGMGDMKKIEKTQIPQAFLRAFKEDKEENKDTEVK